MTSDNTGMVQRGLFLFLLLAAIGSVTLFAVFYRPTEIRKTPPHSEYNLAMIRGAGVGFPASLNWAAVHELGAALPSPPGWPVRYNAVRGLANRGSPQLPLATLAEMLDEQQQIRNNIVVQDGKSYVNEANVQMIVVNALEAVRIWHKHADAVAAVGRDNPELKKVYRAVERLRESNARISTEAKETLLVIQKQ